MSDQDVRLSYYSELRNIYKCYIDSYIALYQLRTENEEELSSIYNMIKTNLIESKIYLPKYTIKDILNIIPYNNRYAKSYLSLAKLISDEFHVNEVNNVESISNYLFYKEYGIKLDKSNDFDKIKSENLNIHIENTIYRAIMDDNKERFIQFTEIDGFDKDQKLHSKLYPVSYYGYSLLELCCYHGSVGCFKLLRSKFKSEITSKCLELSFLGGNPDIMSECLKYQEPNYQCMETAIISHNIDFVTFLTNEYNIKIDLECCGMYNNLESFLVYFDQTKDFNNCFIKSPSFNIPSFCEFFLSNGANINEKDKYGQTALHHAVEYNSKETTELLISHGANVHEKDSYKFTALYYAVLNNNKEMVELFISYGANVDEKDEDERTVLITAVAHDNKEIAELLISHGANVNEKEGDGQSILQNAAYFNAKETAELLISHGANINEKDYFGKTALHIAVGKNNNEMAELLISHGANINEKDNVGKTALHIAVENNSKETVEFLISHGAIINEKDEYGQTALHYALNYNSEISQLLISHGAKN
ncbi:hypothetical protein TVAG_319850 [Trichomonas vaginalis G3]|uniref:DUF3447 domain-containing protein n=1 Tax=Trichomonas vaginalis (strain ATCC PRA-98 / G3) TaxID=412133 RepID=A2DQD3_TRIV3|nr:ankyrin repeat and SOCS box-containing protein 4 family [Trichomonas vaginalis G3]EAY17390.1 hypothetical protein TVAG_319850 [Trichomonas vaginalis G3]KAI5491401.1 ankyrin repeat and SOCS box-containing protein 4 family [Trichomonas vaginalis G3]|eukprot:XP_001330759.1 hypothetical protein [Trichomonas vaginalis G3]